MSEPTIVVTDTPEPRDAEVIVQGLSAFNGEHVGASDRHGWRVMGEIECDRGASRIFMTKQL